jgi:hypothetical protein
VRVEGRGEKWPKQCMYMWINELKKEKGNKNDYMLSAKKKKKSRE